MNFYFFGQDTFAWFSGHVEKTAWLERLISKLMKSQPG